MCGSAPHHDDDGICSICIFLIFLRPCLSGAGHAVIRSGRVFEKGTCRIASLWTFAMPCRATTQTVTGGFVSNSVPEDSKWMQTGVIAERACHNTNCCCMLMQVTLQIQCRACIQLCFEEGKKSFAGVTVGLVSVGKSSVRSFASRFYHAEVDFDNIIYFTHYINQESALYWVQILSLCGCSRPILGVTLDRSQQACRQMLLDILRYTKRAVLQTGYTIKSTKNVQT